MKDKFNFFFQAWNGKPCEVNDPSNLNQCMDLAYAWCDVLGVTRDTIRHQYASQVYTNPFDVTIKFFELVPNTALATPRVGDLVVFKGGTAGHISVANGTGDVNTFQSFDQNWGTTVNKCGIVTHTYDNVLGFLRFRVATSLVITDQTILPIIDANGNKMEVQAVRSKIADQERQITNQIMSMDGLNAKISQLEEQIANPPPCVSDAVLKRLHDVRWGTGFWWTKWAKITELLPK